MKNKIISTGVASAMLITSLATTLPTQAQAETPVKEKNEDEKESNLLATVPYVEENKDETKQKTEAKDTNTTQVLNQTPADQTNNLQQTNTNKTEVKDTSNDENNTLLNEISNLKSQKVATDDLQKTVDDTKANLDSLPYLSLQETLDNDNSQLALLKLALNNALTELNNTDITDEQAYAAAKLVYDNLATQVDALVEEIENLDLTVADAKVEYEKVLADYDAAKSAYDEAVKRNAEIDQEIQDKTYKYVALGDSITAGYSLEGADVLANKGALATELDANKLDENSEYYGVDGSYANLFGADISNAINTNDPTYEVIVKNLGQSAWTSEDLLGALQENPTGLTPYMEMLVTVLQGAELTDEEKAAYAQLSANVSNLINTNVTDADLVSVCIGGNDMISAMLLPLYENQSNPLMQAMLTIAQGTVDLTGQGTKSTSEVYGDALNVLINNKDNITEESVTDFLSYLVTLPIELIGTSNNIVTNARGIISAIEDKSDAQIALLSLYNPYGNSINCEGVTYDMAYISEVITDSILDICSSKNSTDLSSIELPSIEDIMEYAKQYEGQDASAVVMDLAKDVSSLMYQTSLELTSTVIDKVTTLVDNVSAKLAYIMNYATLGSFAEPFVEIINTGFKSISTRDSNVLFVDITDIPNENDADPHPNKYGHAEIAKNMVEDVLPYVHVPMDAVRETIDGDEYDVVYCALHHDVISKTLVKANNNDTKKATTTATSRLASASSTTSTVNTAIDTNAALYAGAAAVAAMGAVETSLKKRKVLKRVNKHKA